MAPDNSRTPLPDSPALISEGNSIPKLNSALVQRDRDFRIHTSTVGDVMQDFHQQLRLRGLLRTLPPLSVAILWLMLDLLDTHALVVENRLIASVSHGYLHDETGRGQTTKQKNVGHIGRAIDALIDANIVTVLAKGHGITPSSYELFIPRTTGNLLGRRSMSGRRSCAGGGGSLPPARMPTKTITRAGGGTNSAPATDLALRQRANTVRAGGRLAPIHYSGSDDADDDLRNSASAEPPDLRKAAVLLLVQHKVSEDDAIDILTDPLVRIADDQLAPTISRLARLMPAKFHTTAGGWWRKALQRHQHYGPDPVRQTVEQHRQRPAPPPLDNYAQLGRSLVEQMPDDQVIEAHVLLLEHFRRNGKGVAIEKLDGLDVGQLRDSADFWRAVAKNRQLLGMPVEGGR